MPASSVFGTKKQRFQHTEGSGPWTNQTCSKRGLYQPIHETAASELEEFRSLAVRAVSSVYIMIVSALVTGTRTDVSTAVILAS